MIAERGARGGVAEEQQRVLQAAAEIGFQQGRLGRVVAAGEKRFAQQPQRRRVLRLPCQQRAQRSRDLPPGTLRPQAAGESLQVRNGRRRALRELALTDDLTKLANRRRLDRDLEALRRRDRPIAIAMIDNAVIVVS